MSNNNEQFDKFDQIGIDILNGLVTWSTHTKNPCRYGWWDSSGTTIHGHQILQEIKCNHSSQMYYDTTIITLHDFENLIQNTPKDVDCFYFTITNRLTYVFNLKKVVNDPEVYMIKTQRNKSKTMGNDGVWRDEQWVYINRAIAKKRGYMTLIKKGGIHFGYNIDKLLGRG